MGLLAYLVSLALPLGSRLANGLSQPESTFKPQCIGDVSRHSAFKWWLLGLECCRSLIREISRTLLQKHALCGFKHKQVITHKYVDNPFPNSQPTYRLLPLQRIQSHREIWLYRPNWIAVIPCLTCFGNVWVGLGDLLPSWAGLLMQKMWERSELSFGLQCSGLIEEYILWVKPGKKKWKLLKPVFKPSHIETILMSYPSDWSFFFIINMLYFQGTQCLFIICSFICHHGLLSQFNSCYVYLYSLISFMLSSFCKDHCIPLVTMKVIQA